MALYNSLEELIGRTPTLRLARVERAFSLGARLYAKLEMNNPGGSAKDRVALQMILDAERDGRLAPGGVIIEPTSGNTGIGLAAVAAARGYRAVIVMPDTMSEERRKLMLAYGAELVLTDGALGMAGAIARANELQKEIPGSIVAGQFENPSNPEAHYRTTGPEILADVPDVSVFVAGVGTGGTITGAGRYLKENRPRVKIVGVEPDTSAVLSGGAAGPHKLQGIGAGFVPAVLDVGLLDEVMPVSADDAYESARMLTRTEGVFTGISGGAALYAAIEEAKRPENAGGAIVVLLPDTGGRYLSTPDFIK